MNLNDHDSPDHAQKVDNHNNIDKDDNRNDGHNDNNNLSKVNMVYK